MRQVRPLWAACCVLTIVASANVAQSKSWCAQPLTVHEWGVQVFSGTPGRRTTGVNALPGAFHTRAGASAALKQRVRDLPADGGERDLPILHFYATGGAPVPVAIEVGFSHGDASAWYPQVDTRRSALDANGPAAAKARLLLLGQRSRRTSDGRGRGQEPPVLPADPTRQLAWENLSLTSAPTHGLAKISLAWVDGLRSFDDALWVNTASESERFVFYEAGTTETPSVRLERGPTYGKGRRHYLLRNTSGSTVFDVFVIHREGPETFVFYAPAVPAGASAGFVLEEHRVASDAFARSTHDRLRAQLQGPTGKPLATAQPSDPRACVMMRDPAIPVEAAEDHHLYAHEIDALLGFWGQRFFAAAGTSLIYREDTRAVDAAMPLSIYTDMFHFVRLHRASLALVEAVALP